MTSGTPSWLTPSSFFEKMNYDVLSYICNFFDITQMLRCVLINKLWYVICENICKYKLWSMTNSHTDFKGLFHVTTSRHAYIVYCAINQLILDYPITYSSVERVYQMNTIDLTNKLSRTLNRRVSNFPKNMCYLCHLIHLYLAYNDIKFIPRSIGKLINLQVLDISNNNLIKLPTEFFNLIHLRTLFLSENKLTELSSNISKLRQLRMLDISHNTIRKIPISIGNNIRIKYLSFYDNQIDVVPDEIENLSNLVFFDISQNNITNIPNGIYQLNNLTHFCHD